MAATPVHESYYLAADVRELDRLAIEEFGIPGFTLMQRAGQAAFTALLSRWPDTQKVICYCGGGNNGGDGYVIAALAVKAGLQATVIAVGRPGSLKGDAASARDLALACNVPILPFDNPHGNFGNHVVLVDAMLGTGLTGPARAPYADAIDQVNALPYPVLAVDIPSGLSSDTGDGFGKCVAADLTVTFIGRKLGQVKGQGPAVCGEVVFDDLGVPASIYRQVAAAAMMPARA